MQNRQPIVTQRGIHRTPPQDMYFKGALFLNTLRSVVDDDARWWKLIHDLYQHFKYQNIMTEDIVQFFNAQLGQNLTPIFDQYLRRRDAAGAGADVQRGRGDRGVSLEGRRAGVRDADPRRGRAASGRSSSRPPTGQSMKTPLKKDAFEVATDLYYVNVTKQ